MDPISDMLTQIRNALAVGLPDIEVPFSNFKFEIAKILEKNNLVEKIEKKGKKTKKFISIYLKYQDKIPVISGLKIISKPGQRMYFRARDFKKVKGGYGIAIVSTSKGIMTSQEAKKQKLGGEVVCEIW